MELMEYLPKLLLASLIGILTGLERSQKGNGYIGAGTTSVMILGSTLLTIISTHCLPGADPSRLIANIIQAVGFLCGGVIFLRKRDNNQELIGLTTGATLFTLTGVGIAIGLGQYQLAIVVAILVEFNIFISRVIKRKVNK